MLKCVCVSFFSFFHFGFISKRVYELSKVIHIPRIWPCWNLCNDTYSHSLCFNNNWANKWKRVKTKLSFRFVFSSLFFLLFSSLSPKCVGNFLLDNNFFFSSPVIKHGTWMANIEFRVPLKRKLQFIYEKLFYSVFSFLSLSRLGLTSICLLSGSSEISIWVDTKTKTNELESSMARKSVIKVKNSYFRKIMFVNKFN